MSDPQAFPQIYKVGSFTGLVWEAEETPQYDWGIGNPERQYRGRWFKKKNPQCKGLQKQVKRKKESIRIQEQVQMNFCKQMA